MTMGRRIAGGKGTLAVCFSDQPKEGVSPRLSVENTGRGCFPSGGRVVFNANSMNSRSYLLRSLPGCATLLGLLLASPSQAATIDTFAEKDSATFGYQNEMDVLPTASNLDGNGVNDFEVWFSNASPLIVPTVAGGILTIPESAANGGGFTYQSADGTAGLAWENSGITVSTGFTVEFRAAVDTTAGVIALIQVAAAPNPGSVAYNIGVNSSGLIDLPGTSYTNPTVDTGFHTYRIASEGGVANRFYVWIDDVAVYGFDDGAAYNNGSSTVNKDQFYFGDGSSSARGELLVDYIRWESGAYAPIPEPNGALLVGLAGIMVAIGRWRRR